MKKTSLLCAAFLIAMLANAQVNLNQGLMAYYPFNGNALDSSGNGNNPSFNNATLTTDRFGNANSAYYFNGNGSYMQIPASLSLDTGSSVSLSFWVKINDFYTGACSGNYVICKGPDNANYLAAFSNLAYENTIGVSVCNVPADTANESFYGLAVGNTTPTIHTGSWYHVVITYDGNISSLYVNNHLVIAQAETVTHSTSDLFLGRYSDISRTPYWLNGVLDDIRIYNRALDSAEVQSLYHQGGFGIPTPAITSFTPNATCSGTSIPVFITGTNFIGATAVTVGGSKVDSFKVNTSTSITTYISNGTSGNIVITTPNGSATSDSTFTFGKGYTGYAYITNYNDGTVSVINTSNNSIAATVQVGSSPWGVGVSPDGTTVYITNARSNTVSVINTATNKVTATINVGNFPEGVSFSPDGTKAYVVNYNDFTVSIINTATNTVTATVAVGRGPYSVSFTPDGTMAYVTNSNYGRPGTVSVINTATNTVIATVTVGTYPVGLSISPDGSTVYVTNTDEPGMGTTVSVINTATNTVTGTITVGDWPIGVNFTTDGTKAYVTNDSSSSVSIINTATNTVIGTVAVGYNPNSISFSLDGTKAYVTNGGSNTVSVINTATDSVIATIAVGNSPHSGGNFIASVPTACSVPPCGSNNSQLVITADTTQGNLFTSGVIDNYDIGCNPSKHEIDIAAWTANSVGVPHYNARTLQQCNISKIPTNAVVNSAKLYYYAKTVGATNGTPGQPTYGTNNVVLLQKCTSPWSTSTLTWNNEPTIDTTTEVILPQSTNTAEDYVVDITNLAQGWVNKPDSNFGFLLRMQTESNPYNSMIFEAGQAFDTTRNARLEICYSVPTVVPITLQSFTASAITFRYTSIQFATANETNAASIEIERSYDGINFLAAGSIAAKGNISLNQYSFTDKVTPNAAIAYYRLKLINKDGTYQYSAIISVQLSVNNDQYSIYPNPAKKFIMVNGKNINQVNIIDNLGRVVVTKKGFSASSILNKVEFSLSPGIYVAQLSTTDGKIVNEKFVVQ